ncbi:MAG TPA: DUF3592 domain-containing protein [Allosphingosinicella sp.]|nr:DUF3592 domain-containing protein [Allosphingosinicella sp.]
MAGLGIFVLLLGVAAAAYGWLGHSKALALGQAAGRWAIAPATILATDVRVARRGGAAYWVPLVHYRFAVGDRHYEGERLRFGFVGTQTRAAAQKMVRLRARIDQHAPLRPAGPAAERARAGPRHVEPADLRDRRRGPRRDRPGDNYRDLTPGDNYCPVA